MNQIIVWIWNKSLNLGAILILVAVIVDYRTSLNFDLTGMLIVYTLWSIMSLTLTRENKVLSTLWATIRDKDWPLLEKFISMGSKLKTSVNANTIFFTYSMIGVVYFIYRVLDPVYRTLNIDLGVLRSETNIIISIILFNGFFAMVSAIIHGTLQNVEKQIKDEQYHGHRY